MKTAEEVAHTPGPWRCCAEYPDDIYAGKRQIAEVTGGRWSGESPHTYEVPVEVLANARLIAAAPELLSALQNIREHMVGMAAYFANCNTQVIVENLETTIRVLRDKTDRANAAIRKAKGQQ